MKRKNLLYIGNALSRKGATVTSIETLGSFLKKEGFNVTTASSKKNKLLRLLDMLNSIIKNRKDVDYVLIDTYSTTNFWYAVSVAWLCARFTIPYIPILRGGDLPNRLQKSPKFCKTLFKNAFINIAPSNYLLSRFSQAGFTNLVFVPNTLDIKKYTFKERIELAPKLLWVRSFSRIYNPMLALKILEKLVFKYPEAKLCMVGPEKEGSMQECIAFAKANSLPVTFTGGLTKEDWIKLAADYDIFINTTNFDNTPVSVMEAMALGLPVISTNVGGIPFLIDDHKDGLLVDPDNLQFFIAAIDKLLADKLLVSELTKKARAKVESYDWEQIKSQWIEILS